MLQRVWPRNEASPMSSVRLKARGASARAPGPWRSCSTQAANAASSGAPSRSTASACFEASCRLYQSGR